MDSTSHETVCQIADRLTSKDRIETYGHPKINFDDIARMWTVILRPILQPGQSITPTQVGLCNVATKICRHIANPKRDNLIDMAGYANAIDKLDEPLTASEWTCNVCGMSNPVRYLNCDNGCIEPVPEEFDDCDIDPLARERAHDNFMRSLEKMQRSCQPPTQVSNEIAQTHEQAVEQAQTKYIESSPSKFVSSKHVVEQLKQRAKQLSHQCQS